MGRGEPVALLAPFLLSSERGGSLLRRAFMNQLLICVKM